MDADRAGNAPVAEAPPPEVGTADVHVGHDGWLFLVGGTNGVLDQYRRAPGDWRHYLGWRRLIADRVRRCARLRATYLHVIVPEKLTVYDDRLDGLAVETRDGPARRTPRWLRLSPARRALVDLVGPLRAARHGEPLYLRTDSHWSAAGAHVAYRAICARLGAVPRDDLLDDPRPEITILGDLGGKLSPPVTEVARPARLPRTAVRASASPIVERFEAEGRIADLHSGARVVFRNDAPGTDPRRLVLFGDSYAHFLWTLRTGTLTGFLAETFAEVHFLWSPTLDWAYLREVRPDVVVGEIAERFTRTLPPRNASIAVLAEWALARKAAGAERRPGEGSDASNADVHVGRDGWLFLVGGTNRVLAQYRAGWAAWWTTWRWARRIRKRERRAARLRIRYLHLVVPEKLTIYDDRLGGLALDPALSPASRLGARLAREGAAWIDLVGPFRAGREVTDLYKRTDTHWTWAGCRLAAETVARACGTHPGTRLAGRPFVTVERVGDLGGKLVPPHAETMRDTFIARDASRSHANALVVRHEAAGTAERLHVGAHVVYRNAAPGADPRRLLLFGDSCAHFAPIGLTIALAEIFREVHFVWSASLDWSFVARVAPDILLAEMAERFLARVPDDRYDVEAGAARRLAALDPAPDPASPTSDAGARV